LIDFYGLIVIACLQDVLMADLLLLDVDGVMEQVQYLCLMVMV
jgi:hypothetical protein